MKKTDLTKEQQKKFKWLMKADTFNEDVEINEYGHLIWYGGLWKNGIWENGTWGSGVWKQGTWKNGIWKNGIWKNGVWEHGIWNNGHWENGIWKYGIWIKGFMWSNLKQKMLRIKQNNDGNFINW